MTDEWYTYFLAAVLRLWAASTPIVRNALRIVLIASLASEVIVDGITHQISGAWKLVIPGALEILTILALLKWARTRTGITQAYLLVFAWLAHLLCYADIYLKTDIVYSRYEAILFWVAVGQIAACYDTMLFNISRASASCAALWADCILGVPRASHGAGVALVSADTEVQAVEGKSAAGYKQAIASK